MGSPCARPTLRTPASARQRRSRWNAEILTPGREPGVTVVPGSATLIATGGMVPRGADAVIMVEHTETSEIADATLIEVRCPAAPGQFIAFAGSDLARGETVLRVGQVLTAREIGMLALPLRIASERGRTEYLMVSLVRGEAEDTLAAYPNAKGSGAVTAFSQADGFITIGQHVEGVPAGTPVEVQLIGRAHLADLVIIGSHCVGLDVLIGRLQSEGISVKALNVGSTGGLAAAKRSECDIAPIHLMDPKTGTYNRPFLTPALELVPGYRRLQGIVFRSGDLRFEGRSIDEVIAAVLAAPDCLMVNRNAGSGTRILTDRLLDGAKPPGYWAQPKSHNAVAVAVAQNRADWGMAIETVARQYRLGFIPAQDEHYDFVVPMARLQRPPVQRFRALLADPAVQQALVALGFKI
jgi:putative molybdopterin biosynthesis protein